MKIFQSFTFKNAIFYVTIFLLGLGIVGYLLLNNSSERIVQTAKNQLQHRGDLVAIQFKNHINQLKNDLDYLSNDPVLTNYLKANTSENYELLAQNYLSLIKSNLNFSQIRFIGADDGKELVRIEQTDGNAQVVSEEKLQYKKDRAYFQETIKLPKDGIYFSKINLNREFGEISIPKIPTLRLSKPIYSNGTLKGIVIINTNLSKLFSKLKKTSGNDFSLRMLNNRGFYLMHEVVDSTFTFEYGDTKPQLDLRKLDTLANTINMQPKALIANRRMHLSEMNYGVVYQVIANRKLLMQDYNNWQKQSVLTVILIGVLFTFIAFYVLNKQANLLRKFTDNLKKFPVERHVSQLPVHRNDEIGDLAKGFEEMASMINAQMKSTELEKQNAQRAEREKTEFIENISHEIRNPLHSIIGLSKLLEQNKPNPNQIELLKSIQLNTNNLLGLVTSILEFQNVLQGRYKATPSWNNVQSLVQDIVTGSKYAAANKSLNIMSIVDAELKDLELNLDQLHISQLLSNLITNAIAHTPVNGEIIVKVAVIQTIKDKITLAFMVKDNGSGMSTQELSQIKERYFSDKVNANQNPNFGLGLTIVNDLLKHMDSELIINSEKKVGATFSFELDFPFRVSTSKKEIKKHTDFLNKSKILVIEDDPQILELYKHFFSETTTDFVSNLDQLNALGKSEYDIIVSDFRVNRTTIIPQLELLKKLSIEGTAFVIVSGASVDFQAVCEVFPNTQFLLKPFENVRLENTIKQAILFAKYGAPNLEVIRKDYDYNKEKYTRALQLLITEWQLSTGRLKKSAETNDWDEFDEVLHKLNTTLRRLQLERLEQQLVIFKEQLQQENSQILSEIEMIMNGYLLYFKQKA